MKNITEKLKNINPTDNVFEHDGKFVKVRVLKAPPPPGAPSFGVAFLEISGSETDERGRALPHGDGWRIAAAERRTVQYDEKVDFPALLQSLREDAVVKTLNASAVEAGIDQHLQGNPPAPTT